MLWLLPIVAAGLLATPSVSQLQAVHARLYPAPKEPISIAGLPPGAAVDTVRTVDGLTLAGIEYPARDGKPVFLVFHGNESSAADTMRWFAPLLAKGYGLIAAEYREYSGNPGIASEAGLAMDADAFYARARQLAGTSRLIVVGHSLGAGVALGLARRKTSDALITIGAFTRLASMVPPASRSLVEDRYDNEGAIATLDEPLYLIHGTLDETVPFVQEAELANAAGKAGKAGASFVVADASHVPAGDVLAMIFVAIATKVAADGKKTEAVLPVSVSVVPFLRGSTLRR